MNQLVTTVRDQQWLAMVSEQKKSGLTIKAWCSENGISENKVLDLDEWLLNDIGKEEIEFLFEFSERRYDIASTIFCTLYRSEDWIKRLGNGADTESIVERATEYTLNSRKNQ